jgi:copper chaperone CopZ
MRAILEVDGAHCGGCVFAIEHSGRKVRGVEDIRVHTADGEIHVDYDGSPDALEAITDIVSRLGHSARVRTADEDAPLTS